MAYESESHGRRRFDPRSLKLDFAPEDEDGRYGERSPRDLKKHILMLGLGALSWVATYIGMLELVQANLGTLPFAHKVVIGFSVAMLMVMIIWLLDQLFQPHSGFIKLAYIGGYLFLTLISVGFGFGFYWKILESRTEASRSAESAVSQVQNSLNGASTRLEQLQATLAQLAVVSREKSELERVKGTSCPNSRPGDGPRRKMRAEDAAKFAFASEFVAGRVGAIKRDIRALDGDLAKITKNDASIIDAKSGTRNEFMRALGRKLDMTVTGFNAFRTDPQLKQMRTDLAERSGKTVFKIAGGGTFSCPDAQLQQVLRGAVRALDQLPVLDKPKIAVVEGSEATIEAFRRLTATLQGVLTFNLPPSADELRELQQKAIRQAVSKVDRAKLSLETAGLSSRDYVPLAIAIFVDLCLLLVSMGRISNRLDSLVPKMRAAERGPVIEILSRFKDIHSDPQVRANFEIFRHVVFDQNGDYYVAVPLDVPYGGNPLNRHHTQYGTEEAQELQHEVHLLANLFTSFEKERIYRRVYNPLLLNTTAIQKKLARQGSKFAGCQAFRVYKFRDGAWSEIILGAVMGAAQRAETKRRRESLENEIFAKSDIGLNSNTARQHSTEDMFQTGPNPTATGSKPASHANGFSDAELNGHLRSGSLRARLDATSQLSPETKAHNAEQSQVSALQEAKFGPYAMHVPTDEPTHEPISQGATPQDGSFQDGAAQGSEADVTLMAPANGNSQPVSQQPDVHPIEISATAPVVPSARDGAVVSPAQMPAIVPTKIATTEAVISGPLTVNSSLTDEGRIDVVLTRDTATMSVPVTEATLPNGVAILMAKALQTAGAELSPQVDPPILMDNASTESATEVLDEPSRGLDYDPVNSDINDPDQEVDQQDGEEVSRLASRFAATFDG